MLFFFFRPVEQDFQRALRAAIAVYHSTAVRALLVTHGERVFARALNDLSGQAIADALGMLCVSERTPMLKCLSRKARRRLREAESRWCSGLLDEQAVCTPLILALL